MRCIPLDSFGNKSTSVAEIYRCHLLWDNRLPIIALIAANLLTCVGCITEVILRAIDTQRLYLAQTKLSESIDVTNFGLFANLVSVSIALPDEKTQCGDISFFFFFFFGGGGGGCSCSCSCWMTERWFAFQWSLFLGPMDIDTTFVQLMAQRKSWKNITWTNDTCRG